MCHIIHVMSINVGRVCACIKGGPLGQYGALPNALTCFHPATHSFGGFVCKGWVVCII